MNNISLYILLLFAIQLKAQELYVVGNKVDTVCEQYTEMNNYQFVVTTKGGKPPYSYNWKNNFYAIFQPNFSNPIDSVLELRNSFFYGFDYRIVCIVKDAENKEDSVVWTPKVRTVFTKIDFPPHFYLVDQAKGQVKYNFEIAGMEMLSVSNPAIVLEPIDLKSKTIGTHSFGIVYYSRPTGCAYDFEGTVTIYSKDSISRIKVETSEKETFVYLPDQKSVAIHGKINDIRLGAFTDSIFSVTKEVEFNAKGWPIDSLVLKPKKRGVYLLKFYGVDNEGYIEPFQLKLHVLDTLFEAQGSARTHESYLKSGKVQAFRKGNDKSTLVQTVDIKSDGTFLFKNLVEGNYYFLAVPDDSLLSPTYYVADEMAQNAYLLDLYGNTESIDILVKRKVELDKNSIQQNIAQLIGNENILTAMKPIDYDEYIESYQLIDVSGKVVASGTVLPDFGEYSGQPDGVYILMLKTNKGMNCKKIVSY